MEADIGIAIMVLDTDNHIADDDHSKAVPGKLLVDGLRAVLLRLNELMVEIKVALLP